MFNVENPNSDLNSAFQEFLSECNRFNAGLHYYNTQGRSNGCFIIDLNPHQKRWYVNPDYLFGFSEITHYVHPINRWW